MIRPQPQESLTRSPQFPLLNLFINDSQKPHLESLLALKMSLDPPTYLSSLQNNIRARPIPWDGAVRAGTISQDQLDKIKSVDKVRKEQRKEVVEKDIDVYRALFVGGDGERSLLESTLERKELVQYILVLLADLLDGKCYGGYCCHWSSPMY